MLHCVQFVVEDGTDIQKTQKAGARALALSAGNNYSIFSLRPLPERETAAV